LVSLFSSLLSSFLLFFFSSSGIYFTRDIDYAALYSKASPKVFVVAAVNPGNTFPVTEHPFLEKQQQQPGVIAKLFAAANQGDKMSLNGKPGIPGYQSHYTVVPKKTISDAFPLTDNQTIDPARHADELVVFQDAQALPLFIFYTS
jgi:hypothetical protein